MVKQEILSFVYQYIHKKLPNVFNNYFIHRQNLSEMIEEKRKGDLPYQKWRQN